MPDTVMIPLSSSVIKRLDSYKMHESDCYSEVISALLDKAEFDDDYLTDEDIAKILKSQQEIREGKYYFSEEIRQMILAKSQ